MDIRSSQPFWPTYNGSRHRYPSLKKDAAPDVLVIGGGIPGALMMIVNPVGR